jgi:phospholipase C
MSIYARTFALLLVATLAACSSSNGVAPGGSVLPAGPLSQPAKKVSVGTYIKHVVIIVQENRSFDNLFGGFPGADTQPFGYTHAGKKIPLRAIPLAQIVPTNHNFKQAMAAYNGGKMNGFDLETDVNTGQLAGTQPYVVIRHSDTLPYWTLAHQYVLADRMFPTMLSASFTAHLDLIAGTSNIDPTQAIVDIPSNMPWTCDAPAGTHTSLLSSNRTVSGNGPYPCFNQFRTMAQTLDAAHRPWRYYAPAVGGGDQGGQVWSEFGAIYYVRNSSDWTKDVVSPPQRVLTDARAGKLAAMSWVIPDWADSDHSWNGSATGPSWVASVVNAIGKGPDWKTTAIFIVWDDWGGLYDNAVPPQRDFRGLGIRVPLIVVSPYAKKGYVSHTQYEFGSILKFAEQAFSLPPLGPLSAGYTETRAASLDDAFDFTQKPRTFVHIKAPIDAKFFEHRRPSLQPVDTE